MLQATSYWSDNAEMIWWTRCSRYDHSYWPLVSDHWPVQQRNAANTVAPCVCVCVCVNGPNTSRVALPVGKHHWVLLGKLLAVTSDVLCQKGLKFATMNSLRFAMLLFLMRVFVCVCACVHADVINSELEACILISVDLCIECIDLHKPFSSSFGNYWKTSISWKWNKVLGDLYFRVVEKPYTCFWLLSIEDTFHRPQSPQLKAI